MNTTQKLTIHTVSTAFNNIRNCKNKVIATNNDERIFRSQSRQFLILGLSFYIRSLGSVICPVLLNEQSCNLTNSQIKLYTYAIHLFRFFRFN